jgi:hypothetical protein
MVTVNWRRRGYELDGLFFGRPIRPFHLAVTLSTGVVAYVLHRVLDAGWTSTAAHTLGAVATVSVVLLTVGWWRTNDWCAEWGLLLATGVWTARGVLIVIDPNVTPLFGPFPSALLSFAWAVGAGGAYMLERLDHELARDDEYLR